MTHNIIHDEKENLWVEVMDDYVRTAELGLYALEQKRHKEEMRGHFEKLWNWHIKSLIKHIDSEIERLKKESKTRIFTVVKHEEMDRLGAITIPSSYESAFELGRTIESKDQRKHLRELKAELTKSK